MGVSLPAQGGHVTVCNRCQAQARNLSLTPAKTYEIVATSSRGRARLGKRMGRRVRLGLAGLGRMGRLHAENLVRSPSIELVRVVDTVEEAARATGEQLEVEWSARAIEAAATAGVKLQVGFHRRFDPDWAAAAARIRAGELGDVHLFRSSLRDKRPPSIDYIAGSGGFFADVTIHDLDTARWMAGEIDEVTAVGAALTDPAFAELGDIDHAVVALRFASGGLGVIDNSRAAGYGYECSAEVMGSRATVRIGHHRLVHNQWLTPGEASVDWVVDFTQLFRQ